MSFECLPFDVTPSEEMEEGFANIKVTHLDGTESFFTGIRYDSNRMENGFLVMEAMWDIYHVCNARVWEVVYS